MSHQQGHPNAATAHVSTDPHTVGAGYHLGEVLPEAAVYELVQAHHHTPDDFFDGDLGDRIERFSHYVVTLLELDGLDLGEFFVDDALVEAYAARIRAGETPPPIVFDAPESSLIDGIHRANAWHQCGCSRVLALVGTECHLRLADD